MVKKCRIVTPPGKPTNRAAPPSGKPAGRTLVFSFGSNLSTAQLQARCPDMTLACPASLPGYRLAFVGYSSRCGGGVATLRRDPKCCAVGELALLTDEDLKRLDMFEGCPNVYRRVQVRVMACAQGGTTREVTAWTYLRDGHEETPSPAYIARVASGYGRLGYDEMAVIAAIGAAEEAVSARWKNAARAHNKGYLQGWAATQ